MTLWIVGKTLDAAAASWEFQGVFSTEARAVAACVRWEDFVAPAELDRALPDATEEFPGGYYPMQRAHAAGACLPGCACKAAPAAED